LSEASEGQEALSIGTQHEEHIHLLITDLVMSKVGGRELAGMLKVRRPDLKTLYMSGYTDNKVLRHGHQESETTLLRKPFSLDTLARKVRDALGPAATPQ
jgi:DNA-binding NtrC family response regulator